MRATAVTLSVFALTCLTGAQCSFLQTNKTQTPPPGGVLPLPPRPAGDFVAYLNGQANAVQSVRYDDVSLAYTDQEGWKPRLNSGLLVCSRPRNFRLMAETRVTSKEVEVGSNNDEFWMYVKRADFFGYCSYDDFARGKVNLPIPFDPEWVLQALGMSTYPDAQGTAYAVEENQKDRQYLLTWEARTPQGEAITKTVVFAGDSARGEQPQVLRHIVRDANKNVVATAEVRKVEPAVVGGTTVLVPTHVVLEWPGQKAKMDLTLGDVKVNEAMSQQEMAHHFNRPKFDGVKAVNLATVRFQPSSIRGATPGVGTPRTFGGR
jgi:hypothetical protein